MDLARPGRRPESEQGLRLRLRSDEKRVESQHQKLDEFCREVYSTLGKEGPRAAINDFLLYEAAVEAHMTLEEEVYFPALHGLRADLSEKLSELVRDHVEIRTVLDEIKSHLKANSESQARLALEALGRFFHDHEVREESLFVRVSSGPVAATGSYEERA